MLSWLAGCQTSILVAALDDLPDGDADVLVVLSGVRLRRLAPTAIKQNAGGLHARGGWEFFLAHDRGEVTNSSPPYMTGTVTVCPLVLLCV